MHRNPAHTICFVVSFVIMVLVLGSCARPTASPSVDGLVEPPADDTRLVLPGELDGKTWDEIVALANGQTINWWMWGGSDVINKWVNGWVKDELASRYNITLNQVPVAGPTEFINQVLGEKQAGNDADGSVDLMWINGENFRTMREADLLYGPWSELVPTSRYINWDDKSIAMDFGYPVEGYELPYGSAQFVMGYHSDKVTEPPASIAGLGDLAGRASVPRDYDGFGGSWSGDLDLSAIPPAEPFHLTVAACADALLELELALDCVYCRWDEMTEDDEWEIRPLSFDITPIW